MLFAMRMVHLHLHLHMQFTALLWPDIQQA